jgi:hypothetical protein
MTAANLLAKLETELKFIGRSVQHIEPGNSRDFELVDQIGLAVEDARRILHELQLLTQPGTTEETTAGVSEPDRDEMPKAA